MLWTIYKKVVQPLTITYMTKKEISPSSFVSSPSPSLLYPNNITTTTATTTAQNLIQDANLFIKSNNVNEAFSTLAQVYSLDPNTNGLQKAFESCLMLKINVTASASNDRITDRYAGTTTNVISTRNVEILTELAQDRLGLASLLIDQERYEEASYELREIVSSLHNTETTESTSGGEEKDASTLLVSKELLTKARVMLYRTSAAACDWNYNTKHVSDDLLASILKQVENRDDNKEQTNYNLLHPFDALKWSFLNLENTTSVARMYSKMARDNVKHFTSPVVRKERYNLDRSRSKVIKLGYISPDFTGNHPLAFLTQDVFQLHNRSQFSVNVYSLTKPDSSPEVQKIKNGCDEWKTFSPQMSSIEIAQSIQNDELDVMIDLCSHAGTRKNAEIMACRVAPVQISYMGFPGSCGVEYLHDYLVCDSIVVPVTESDIRRHYAEKLIIMPHCYFVNSHRSALVKVISKTNKETAARKKYGLPKNAFVYCCHSRPDKIDADIFRTWLKALVSVRQQGIVDNNPFLSNAVLWLLRSGLEMERNLRSIALTEFGLDEDALIFAPIAPRLEHLQRLGLADVFCDTPSYNAHTLGCDALFLGVPMISLLCNNSVVTRGDNNDNHDIIFSTDKLASRVGASLLASAGLKNCIAPSLLEYEKLLIRCAIDSEWFGGVKHQLESSRLTDSLLFDTKRWVKNFERGIIEACCYDTTNSGKDIFVRDDDQ